MSNDTVNDTSNSTPTANEYEANIRDRLRTGRLVKRALEEQQRLAKQPRRRAKARAEEAAAGAVETLGVHDPLPDAPEFNSLRTAREGIHQSVVTALQSMARAFDNESLDSPQSISRVADIGREVLAQHVDTINGLRTSLTRLRSRVEERLQAARTPPSHLAHMVDQARDALRAMSPADREALIDSARGDEVQILMYAIGAAPAFLSGVQPGQQMQQRTMLLGVRDPELLMLEASLPEAFAALDKMEAGIASMVNSVADFDAAKALSDLQNA